MVFLRSPLSKSEVSRSRAQTNANFMNTWTTAIVKGGLTEEIWDDMVDHNLEISHLCGNNSCMESSHVWGRGHNGRREGWERYDEPGVIQYCESFARFLMYRYVIARIDNQTLSQRVVTHKRRWNRSHFRCRT
jgi:hypothetical protein